MNRREFLESSSATLVGVAMLRLPSLAQQATTPPATAFNEIRRGVGYFTGQGGTIGYLVNGDGAIAVDSQFPATAGACVEGLKQKAPKGIDLLINTHHHGDHSSGNISFKGIVDHVLAHENSKTNQQQSAVKNKTEDKQLYPDQTYSDVWCQSFGKENICLHYFGAGHTNGDSLVQLEKANIVHLGDLLFNRRHPFVDRSAGANMQSWITVLDKALDKFNKKTTYVFGHAADGYNVKGTAEDLKAFSNYLEKTLQYVETNVKAGKSKDEIIASTTTIPGAEEWKGDGIDRPLTAAYEELTKK